MRFILSTSCKRGKPYPGHFSSDIILVMPTAIGNADSTSEDLLDCFPTSIDKSSATNENLASQAVSSIIGALVPQVSESFCNIVSSSFFTGTTLLTIQQDQSADTIYSVLTSLTGIDKSSGDGFLGYSELQFERLQNIRIELNGVNMLKGIDVLWESPSTFKVTREIHRESIITIFS